MNVLTYVRPTLVNIRAVEVAIPDSRVIVSGDGLFYLLPHLYSHHQFQQRQIRPHPQILHTAH
jgi:hypothetical protein